MDGDLINTIQHYVAITSVGASTVRGSPKGTVDISRKFLSTLSLNLFGVKTKRIFYERLDNETERLKKLFPPGRRHWALARKLLNIFLHNAFYNYYLRNCYNLKASEQFFEVPIDSVVAKALRGKFPRGTFGPWPSLKRLSKVKHTEYQCYASIFAATLELSRVHLDAILWVQER